MRGQALVHQDGDYRHHWTIILEAWESLFQVYIWMLHAVSPLYRVPSFHEHTQQHLRCEHRVRSVIMHQDLY